MRTLIFALALFLAFTGQAFAAGDCSTGAQRSVHSDFDGDGLGDSLWRNVETGKVLIWFYDFEGNVLTREIVGVAFVGLNWTIMEKADYNGDCMADIFWQHRDGTVIVWLMDGTEVNTAVNLGFVHEKWQLQ